jgi:hypothetical protein
MTSSRFVGDVDDLVMVVEKFNPNHEPGGSPKGGEFAHREGPGTFTSAGAVGQLSLGHSLRDELEFRVESITMDDPQYPRMAAEELALRDLEDWIATEQGFTAADRKVVLGELVRRGIYREVSQQEYDNTSVSGGRSKASSFPMFDGKRYVFDRWTFDVDGNQIQKANPYHEPAGSYHGGEFARKPGTEGMLPRAAEAAPFVPWNQTPGADPRMPPGNAEMLATANAQSLGQPVTFNIVDSWGKTKSFQRPAWADQYPEMWQYVIDENGKGLSETVTMGGDTTTLRDMLKLEAEFRGTTPEALEAELQAKVEAVVGDSELWVRRSSEGFSKLLDDGRFKTQYESNRTSGYYEPGFRQSVEEHVFGYERPKDYAVTTGDTRTVRRRDRTYEAELSHLTPEQEAQRPIYGYLATKADVDGAGPEAQLDQYGPVAIRLKPDVRSRTTFLGDDSLDLLGHAEGRYVTTSAYAVRLGRIMAGKPASELDALHLPVPGRVYPTVTSGVARMVPSAVLHPRWESMGIMIPMYDRGDLHRAAWQADHPEVAYHDIPIMSKPTGHPTSWTPEQYQSEWRTLVNGWKYVRTQKGEQWPIWDQTSSPLTQGGYVETQMHGGLKLSDIAEVVYRSPTPPGPTFVRKMKKAGLAWRYVNVPVKP